MRIENVIAVMAVCLATLHAGCKFAELPPLEHDGSTDGSTGDDGNNPVRFTLTVIADGPGVVSSRPAGISCGGDTCTAQFMEGESVDLTAMPDANAGFAGYSGACSGGFASCAVAMTADRSVTASFIAFVCTPNTTTCSQQVLNECDANGTSHASVCDFGCHPSGTRCYDLQPSNVEMAACLDDAAVEADVAIPDGATLNTDSGTVTLSGGGSVTVPSGTITAPPGAVPVRCFRGNNISIGRVTVVGAAGLAIAANGTVTITGHVSVSARGYDSPGPGHLSAYTGCNGGNSGSGGGFAQLGGGGGGGFGTSGGAGGTGGNNATAGAAGPSNGNAELVPLRGGCSGGGPPWGGGDSTRFRNAGGAVQIVSRKGIAFTATGGISANGWGGGWDGVGSTTWTNHGGGSGGGILLEAPSVTAPPQSFIVANGGSGGSNVTGNPGMISTSPALGPPGDSLYAAAGRGGSLTTAPFAGAPNGTNAGGGGGGAVGRIRLNVYNAFVPDAAAILSPSPSTAAPDRR